MLTALILIPLIAAVLVLLTPRSPGSSLPRLIAVAATAVTLLIGLMLFLRFDPNGGMQFQHIVDWVPSMGLRFNVGADGLNIGLLLMGTLVAFAATAVSWDIKTLEKEFYALLLVMIGGILGAFASQDLFWFYFFHELALVPTFIMIGVWGRGGQRGCRILRTVRVQERRLRRRTRRRTRSTPTCDASEHVFNRRRRRHNRRLDG